MINDPATLEFILKTEFAVFQKGSKSREIFQDFLGHGIFNVDGERWKSQRKLAANIFNVKNFKDFVNDTFKSEMHEFSSVLAGYAATQQEFDLQDLFFRFTFDSFMKIGYGTEMKTVRSSDKVPFMVAFESIQARLIKRLINPAWKYSEYLTGETRTHTEQIKIIRDFGRSIIQEKQVEGGEKDNDLLSLLMRVKDDEGNLSSHDDLVDYVLNFLLAGRDTTAITLSWAVFLLHKNPATLEALLTEINSVLNRSCAPTYEQIRNEMPYTKAVFHETLRLYPSIPRGRKEAQKDILLPDGTFVEKGSFVGWSPYSMGRTEAIWGPDAKEFKPERWLKMEKQPSPFNYPAFNAGPRICLGKGMAELEGVFVLVELMRQFEIRIVKEEEVTYGISMLLPMKNGLKVTCTFREHAGLEA
ncbi:cytochrome P450 [Rhizoclosmatium globosum]|uniref:Cytochrome P450 n=1 Tax=Rhizoclosmatium globosum TaxID=329046 RepID=A0A1Y2CJK4_9FUNG|nr:cytochrome P450 [Rhizoclosmatium globosum]|eukprot:ORY47209.1 cytochrome P450 [Rhizoclosmatium globosum]